MKNILITFLTITSLLATAQISTSFSAMPRTIKVEGENFIDLDIDEIDLDLTIVNETETNKIKMPLDKVEMQLKLNMTSKGVSSSKYISSTDPTLCNATYKSISLKGLTLKEYNAIYPYFSKHLFVSNVYVSKRVVKKESVEKISESLMNGAVLNAKNKAENIAKVVNEKIKFIQSVDGLNLFTENKNYEENSGTFDSIQPKIRFKSNVNVEYALESPQTTNTVDLPRTIRVTGIEIKTIQKNDAVLTFNFSLQNYEEGDPKVEFEKAKKDLTNSLVANGIKLKDITQAKQYDDNEMNLSYTVIASGFNTIEKVNKLLSFNRNVSSLYVTSSNEMAPNFESYNQDMLLKAIANADSKASKIANLFGISLGQKFDIVDYKIFEDYTSNDGIVANANLSSLIQSINKTIYISYLIK